MRVIKDGTKHIEITCEHCKSILEYEQEDIKHEYKEECSSIVNERPIGMFGKQYYSSLLLVDNSYITCPICGNNLVVKRTTQDIGEKIFDDKELTSVWY